MYNSVIDNIEKCYGCGACVEACPTDCLVIRKDEMGFSIVKMDDPDKCVSCGKCTKVCQSVINNEKSEASVKRYWAQNKNSSVLMGSSSGGVFPALAEAMLEKGGVVWGVAMNENGDTEFRCVSERNELPAICGSKYVEVISPVPFAKIRTQLDNEQNVLFSGTPCQVRALNTFLGKEYKNLIMVDLLCYGIQSPVMWHKYLSEINKEKLPIKSVSMRYKKPSWESYGMKIEYQDGSVYKKSRWKDPYLLTYSKGFFTRNICSECTAKKFPKCSDITIGDFWQIDAMDRIPEELNISKGVSVVISNSSKGTDYLQNAGAYLLIGEIPDKVFPGMLDRYSNASKPNTDKNKFIDNVNKTGFGKTVSSLKEPQLKKRLRFIWLGAKRTFRKKTGL